MTNVQVPMTRADEITAKNAKSAKSAKAEGRSEEAEHEGTREAEVRVQNAEVRMRRRIDTKCTKRTKRK